MENKDEWEYDGREIKDPYEGSQGFKKLWNYFLNIVQTEKFQNDIKAIRHKYSIEVSENGTANDLQNGLRIPFLKEMGALSSKYGLTSSTWWTTFEPYIFNNTLVEPMDTDICILSDNINDPDLSQDDVEHHPVSIRISPYASKRDILDFVERIYPFIASIQDSYKDPNIKIGKFNTRDPVIKEREDFIYQNKHLPRKEVMKMVTDKFGKGYEVDYAYIGKIISNTEKRRKGV